MIRRASLLSSFWGWAALVLAAMLFVGGALLSDYTRDWAWFARSGCAVVIIGILLTSQQIFLHLERLSIRRSVPVRRRQNAASKDINPSNHDWANDPHMRRWLDGVEEVSWINERWGLILLLLGTVVWGFGDLLGLINV